MRHRVKGGKIGRTASHRKATLRALATALFKHKKIKTTIAKARAAREFVEPLITKAKSDTVHTRRQIAQHINDKAIVKELFTDIVEKIGDRPGGYTRIVKLGQRQGDASEMAILELVDFFEIGDKQPRKADKAEVKEETVVEDAQVVEETETEKKVSEEATDEKEKNEEVKAEVVPAEEKVAEQKEEDTKDSEKEIK